MDLSIIVIIFFLPSAAYDSSGGADRPRTDRVHVGLNIIGSFPVLHTIQSEERVHPGSDRSDVDLSNIVLFFLFQYCIRFIPRKVIIQGVIVSMWT